MGVESIEGGALPPRLLRIVPFLAGGMDNHEIAEAASLAKHTVEEYVHELKELLGEPNRVKLAMRCREMVKNGEVR